MRPAQSLYVFYAVPTSNPLAILLRSWTATRAEISSLSGARAEIDVIFASGHRTLPGSPSWVPSAAARRS